MRYRFIIKVVREDAPQGSVVDTGDTIVSRDVPLTDARQIKKLEWMAGNLPETVRSFLARHGLEEVL